MSKRTEGAEHNLLRWEGPTNQPHRVTLPSAIESVRWTRRRAAPGGMAGLEIRTRFVGDGAPAKIQLLDGKGRVHGRFSDELSGNRLWADVAVPQGAEQALVADVRLPAHGLQQTSPALFVTPPVAIKNVRWSREKAMDGEVLSLSASVQGPLDGTRAQVRVFACDAEGIRAALARFPARVENGRVEAEWAVRHDGDLGGWPTQAALEERIEATGVDHGGYEAPRYRFRVTVRGVTGESGALTLTDWLEVRAPALAGGHYELERPDRATSTGGLSDTGRLRLDDLPPGLCCLRVTLPERRPSEALRMEGADGERAEVEAGRPPSAAQRVVARRCGKQQVEARLATGRCYALTLRGAAFSG